METPSFGVMVVLIGLGTLFWVGLMGLACYCFQVRRKRLRLLRRSNGHQGDDEEETILPASEHQSVGSSKLHNGMSTAPTSGNSHPAYGMARKLKNLGKAGIGFRTPLIRTRSVGAQLDAGVSATLPMLASAARSTSGSASNSTTTTPLNSRRSAATTTSGDHPSSRTAGSSSRTATSSLLNGGASGSSSNGGANASSALLGYNGGGSSSLSAGGYASTAAMSSSASPTSSVGDKSSAGAIILQQQQPGGAGKSAGGKQEHPSMAFWQNRSISLVDMYIDNSEPTENVGQIHFSLEYDFQNTTLILKIMQGKDLPAKDLSGTSDPYVRVTLLPDKKHRLETKIKRRTLNPRWNETFYFEGFPIQKLQSRVLHLHVFDYDRFSRDDSIGEVFLPLCQVDFSEKPTFWKALKPPLKDKCGELLVSLCYHPTNSTLTLIVLKARSLKAKDINGKSDPYVKVWLYFGDKRVEKRKTPVYKCNLDPVFNETFTFNVPWEKIRECSLDVRVMDFDNIGRNELIGRISLTGKNSTGASETKHWQDMITKPRQAVVQWHRLKPE